VKWLISIVHPASPPRPGWHFTTVPLTEGAADSVYVRLGARIPVRRILLSGQDTTPWYGVISPGEQPEADTDAERVLREIAEVVPASIRWVPPERDRAV
jgi:hypothetical protein